MGSHFYTITTFLPALFLLIYFTFCFIITGEASIIPRYSNQIEREPSALLSRSDIDTASGSTSGSDLRNGSSLDINFAPFSGSALKHSHSGEDFEDKPMLQEAELEKIKQSILDALGLKTIPDVRKMNVSQEEYTRMYRFYVRRQDEKRVRRMVANATNENSTYTQNTAIQPNLPYTVHKFFTFNYQKGDDVVHRKRHRRNTDNKWLYFPIDVSQSDDGNDQQELSESDEVEIEHATLRLLVPGVESQSVQWEQQSDSDKDISTMPVTVNVYQHVDRTGKKRLIEKRDIYLSRIHPKWADFDIRTALENWLTGDVDNLGLEVQCNECDKLNIKLIDEDFINKAAINTLIKFEIDSSIKRTKRSTGDKKIKKHLRLKKSGRTTCSKKDKKCCRHKMEVVFKELKPLDFIIHPKKFDAGFCKGRCPLRYNVAHHHAMIQGLMWKKNKSAPKPCCAPSRLAPLEIIHLADDQQNLELATWENTEVLECACS